MQAGQREAEFIALGAAMEKRSSLRSE